MKKKFSTLWISSRQIRKQKKYRHNAPLHIRHKFLSANLSKELRKKYGKKSLSVRKGDEVLVLRGSFRKKIGKIVSVDLKRGKVVIDGINRKKADGTKVSVYVRPSSLQIQSLNLEDSKRLKTKKFKKSSINLKEQKIVEEKNASNKSKSK